jgi:hypothetical protein
MGRRSSTRGAYIAHSGSTPDWLAGSDGEPREVGVPRGKAKAVVDHYDTAITRHFLSSRDPAVGCRYDRLPIRGRDVYA